MWSLTRVSAYAVQLLMSADMLTARRSSRSSSITVLVRSQRRSMRGAGNWWLTDVGDYHAAAALAADADGTNQRPIIVLEWPARLNHSEQRETIRMLIDPEDAFAISGLLMHSVRWLEECKARGLIP